MKDFVRLSLTFPFPPTVLLTVPFVPMDDASRHADASFTTDKSCLDSIVSQIDDFLDLGPYGF